MFKLLWFQVQIRVRTMSPLWCFLFYDSHVSVPFSWYERSWISYARGLQCTAQSAFQLSQNRVTDKGGHPDVCSSARSQLRWFRHLTWMSPRWGVLSMSYREDIPGQITSLGWLSSASVIPWRSWRSWLEIGKSLPIWTQTKGRTWVDGY